MADFNKRISHSFIYGILHFTLLLTKKNTHTQNKTKKNPQKTLTKIQ